MVERESDKQTSSSTECPLREDIRWHAPVLLEYTCGNNGDLGGQWHSELAEFFRGGLVVASSAARFLVQLVDLRLNGFSLFTLLPYIVPIRALSRRSGVDDLEHEFSWVLVIFTVPTSILLEVFEKCPRVFSLKRRCN